jgi:PAS domain S-box-containing protein
VFLVPSQKKLFHRRQSRSLAGVSRAAPTHRLIYDRRVAGDTLSDELLRQVANLRTTSAELARREALLASAEEAGQMGSWELRRSGELVWSDNLYRLYGYEPGEVTPSPQIVFDLTHPDDRTRVEEFVRRLMDRGEFAAPLEYRIRLRGRGIRYLRATLAVVEERGGRPSRMIGSVFDVTDERRADRVIAAHVAVSDALAQWETTEQGLDLLLGGLAAALDCVVGVLWLPHEDVLVARHLWRSGAVDGSELEAARFRRGCGVPARAWRQRAPVVGEPVARRRAATRAGVAHAVAFPALHQGEVLAVLELLSADEPPVSARTLRSLAGMGYEIGHFLANRRGELTGRMLTARELQVLRLLAQGLTRPQIAERLSITRATAKTHVEHIYAKLDVVGRAAAVAVGLRQGLIS